MVMARPFQTARMGELFFIPVSSPFQAPGCLDVNSRQAPVISAYLRVVTNASH